MRQAIGHYNHEPERLRLRRSPPANLKNSPPQRMPKKILYSPNSAGPFAISRAKIQLFSECPRCFYLDQRLGVGRPPSLPFTLNDAVDKLMKNEFDAYRDSQTTPPLLAQAGLAVVPYRHADLADWRNFRKGLRALHAPTNFDVYGALDDSWVDPATDTLVVADYKATAKKDEATIDGEWQISYKRQVELYQWLLRERGFPVADTAWFVYANGNSAAEAFNARLEFRVTLLSHHGDTSWVVPVLESIKATLNSETLPPPGKKCTYCKYLASAAQALAPCDSDS